MVGEKHFGKNIQFYGKNLYKYDKKGHLSEETYNTIESKFGEVERLLFKHMYEYELY